METPTFYAILPASVRYDARLKAAEKILYCEITSLSNAKKYCHAGNNYFATLYDVDERTIRRWLHNLEELGYLLIEYEKQGDGQQRRIIPLDNAPAGVPEMSAPDKIVRPTRTEMSGAPGQNCPPEYYKNNNTRENNAGARARACVSDIIQQAFPDDSDLTKALTSFAESRKAGKHPLTVRAAELVCSKLRQLADEAGVRDRSGYMIAVLEQSILRGWEGLFPLKDDFVDRAPVQRMENAVDEPRNIASGDDIRNYLGGSNMEISHQQINQRAFLGAALVDPAGAHGYILKLTPSMFDEGACRDTFAAIQRLTYAGEPVDPVTVVNMATSATLSADNLKRNIMQMAETCPSVANVGSYAAQIVEDYRYQLIQADLLKCMAKDAMDADSVCRQLRRTLSMQDAIRNTQEDSTARDFDAVLDSALAQLDEPDNSLKLGWPELDRFGVFHRTRVCVVAGRPGCGKTDFSLNLASRLSKKYRVYYLTLEETAEALMNRMLSKVSRIDSGKITNKRLDERERRIIDNTAGALRQHHNMMLDADSNLTIDGLEAKLMQYKPDVAFVDHIGLLSPTDPRQTEYQRISEITRRLKVAAMKMGIVIVELCQISRSGVKGSTEKFCNLEDLRGSGTIEQDANSAIFVENRRPEDSQELRGYSAYQKTAIMYAKNREGPTGVVAMRWQPQYHDWQPAPKEDYDKMDQTSF